MVKYIIRPSKRQELIRYVNNTYEGVNRSRTKSIIIENKPKSYIRWSKWFDLEVLDDILMEEDCEEVPVEDAQKYKNLGI